jgi:hypothetical protein
LTPRKVAAAYVGALGFDTVATQSAVSAKALYNAGMRFAVRYLGGISRDEVDIILNAKLALQVVTYSRAPGWVPTAAMGDKDGAETVAFAKAAGVPTGATVWIDLEGPGGHAQDIIDWVNAKARVIRQAGYDPGLYVGYQTQLSSHELYQLGVDRYWHSLSRVTDSAGQIAEPTCGWCQYQLYPTTHVVGYEVDLNIVQQDYSGRTPNWILPG